MGPPLSQDALSLRKVQERGGHRAGLQAASHPPRQGLVAAAESQAANLLRAAELPRLALLLASRKHGARRSRALKRSPSQDPRDAWEHSVLVFLLGCCGFVILCYGRHRATKLPRKRYKVATPKSKQPN